MWRAKLTRADEFSQLAEEETHVFILHRYSAILMGLETSLELGILGNVNHCARATNNTCIAIRSPVSRTGVSTNYNPPHKPAFP